MREFHPDQFCSREEWRKRKVVKSPQRNQETSGTAEFLRNDGGKPGLIKGGWDNLLEDTLVMTNNQNNDQNKQGQQKHQNQPQSGQQSGQQQRQQDQQNLDRDQSSQNKSSDQQNKQR